MRKHLPFLIIISVLGALGVLSYFTTRNAAVPTAASGAPVAGPRGPVSFTGPSTAFSELVAAIKRGEVSSIRVLGETATAELTGEETLTVYFGEGDLVEKLAALGVTERQLASIAITFVKPTPSWVVQILIFAAIGGVALIFILSRRKVGTGGPSGPMGAFGQSGAKLIKADTPTVTFTDVAGVEEAKQELAEVVEFLKDPEKFIALGARIPRGVILWGPPGCGKTLLAKAVSGEAGVPFFSIAGSQFVEMFVGVGASRVRDLFGQAKKHAPCIVFVDEIDAVGAKRIANIGGGGQEANQTLNELLAQMDGFEANTNIVVMAATNRLDVLDPALLRSGRFDRRVYVDQPDVAAREKIFAVHTKGKPLAEDVSLQILAAATPGFSGADIENTVNEAAILAVRRGRRDISMAEFQEAAEKAIAGPERKSRIISPQEKRVIAYHEAGHALAMHYTPTADPVLKISIISRGMALGYTMPLSEDRVLHSKEYLKGEIVSLLGGRAAEELILSRAAVTTGASNDLQRASELARRMVTEWGMGNGKVGLRSFAPLPGAQMELQRPYSEATAQDIDAQIGEILEQGYTNAKDTLAVHREQLEKVVARLLEVENVDREEFLQLLSE